MAAVILEPVQNSGGCFVPQEGYFQRVREICDRHGVLLISDEVICSWGRLGHWFGCERYGYEPDIDHDRQGHHLGVRADGGGDRGRPRRRAVPARQGDLQPRLHLRRAPGRERGRAGEHRDARARGALRARAHPGAGGCARRWRVCATCRSSATCAGPATSRRSSWSRTSETKADVRRARVRGAAARLPLRRALPPRADLPHRRSRRARDPALAAADRGSASSSRRSRRSCAPVLSEAWERMGVS